MHLASHIYSEENDEHKNKIQKFRDVMKKQKDYINNARKNDEIMNNMINEQLQEKNLRNNLFNSSNKKNKNKALRIFNNKMFD